MGNEQTQERRNATPEEIKTLPKVVDSLSFNVWIALLASAAERFSFYAVTTPWRKTQHLSNWSLFANSGRKLHSEST